MKNLRNQKLSKIPPEFQEELSLAFYEMALCFSIQSLVCLGKNEQEILDAIEKVKNDMNPEMLQEIIESKVYQKSTDIIISAVIEYMDKTGLKKEIYDYLGINEG